MRQALKPMGGLVGGVLEGIGVTPGRYALAALVEQELSRISPTAKVVAFRQDKLVVEVDSSVELQELSLRHREVSRRMRDLFALGELTAVPELKFCVRGMFRPWSAAKGRTGSK